MRPALRTRTKKRTNVRLPGKRSTTHFKKEKVKGAHCVHCGQLLNVPRLTPSKLGKLSLTQRKTERLYSGQICHNCLRELIKQTVRTAAT